MPISVPSRTYASSSSSSSSIAIVGGGIGGMAVAVFLREQGYQNITIFETRTENEIRAQTESGNGINLYFQCVRMLVHDGKLTDLCKYIAPTDSIQVQRDDGQLIADVTRKNQVKMCPGLNVLSSSCYGLLRHHLLRVLVDSVLKKKSKITVYYEKKCIKIVENGDNNNAKLNFRDGSHHTADLVIGADGIHSVVADYLHKGPRPLCKSKYGHVQGCSTYTGFYNMRTQVWHFHRNGGTLGIVPTILPSGNKGVFWWCSYHNDKLPKKSEEMTNMEFWTFCYQQYPDNKAIQEVAKATDPKGLVNWEIQDKDPLPPHEWTSEHGRIVLLGDACHAALPSSGYGAGMTIEDAYWLAQSLGQDDTILSGDNTHRLKAALQQYIQKRAKYTADIVHEARNLMSLVHPTSWWLLALYKVLFWIGLPGFFIQRQFVHVFKTGLSETCWTIEEKKNGKLDL